MQEIHLDVVVSYDKESCAVVYRTQRGEILKAIALPAGTSDHDGIQAAIDAAFGQPNSLLEG